MGVGVLPFLVFHTLLGDLHDVVQTRIGESAFLIKSQPT